MNPRTQELLLRLEQTDWFRDCAQPQAPSDEAVMPVRSWTEALAICTSPTSEDARLEARNEMAGFLTRHAPEWPQWHSRTRRIQPLVNQLIDRKLAEPEVRARVPQAADPAIRDAVCRDLLALCMAREYGDVVRTRYVELVEQAWLEGRFPCGWVGRVPDDMRDAFESGRLAVL